MSELRILPLGGCGEVGLNATLLIDGQDALLVDCGILLGVPNAPGVDRAVPGFEPLFKEHRRLAGVVLTHGHEDHIGALPALLGEVDVPVFGTGLTIALARARLEGLRGKSPVPDEARRQSKLRLVAVPLGGKVAAGPFHVELIRVTHSLPDSAALFIESRAGRVLVSGDFKLDPRPHDGRLTDVERLKALGEQGVDVLLSDSTNAEVPGRSGSETDVGLEIERTIGASENLVVVACLASHLHRIEAIISAAKIHGRRVALVGRALHETYRIAIEEGHLRSDPTLLVAEERIPLQPRRDLVVITTGSQGEPLGGLSRFASGRDQNLRVQRGDRVIISARTIPGNERAVRRMINQLVRQDVEVITDRMEPVHCSGHAHQAEQAELIRIVKPRNFIPVHGERAMLEAHRRTAIGEGIAADRIQIVEDGESAILSGGTLARGPSEEVSRRALDQEGRVLDWGDVKDRARIGRSGLVVCSLAVERKSGRLLDRPAITARGLSIPPAMMARIEAAVAARVDGTASSARGAGIESAIRNVLRPERRDLPEVQVHVLEIDAV